MVLSQTSLPPFVSKGCASLAIAGEMKDELASDVLLWEPAHGIRSRGRPCKTFIDQLAEDAGCFKEDLPTAMGERDQWKILVNTSRASST